MEIYKDSTDDELAQAFELGRWLLEGRSLDCRPDPESGLAILSDLAAADYAPAVVYLKGFRHSGRPFGRH